MSAATGSAIPKAAMIGGHLPARRDGLHAIIAEVAWHMGLDRSAITGPCRKAELVRARAAIVWIALRLGSRSLNQIGRTLGGRDHSTVRSAWTKAEEALRPRDPAFRRMTDRLLDHFRDLQED